MPPKAKFTREEIVQEAIDLVREEGQGSLTARSLAKRLKSSACPIFTLFESMEEVKNEALKRANSLYNRFLEEDIGSGKYPPYKGSGMAYIRFAREEKELFKWLFMRDRSNERVGEDRASIAPLLAMLQESLGISEDEAYRFHLETWIYVHGIATMLATDYLAWDGEFISRALTDMYYGLRARYQGETR